MRGVAEEKDILREEDLTNENTPETEEETKETGEAAADNVTAEEPDTEEKAAEEPSKESRKEKKKREKADKKQDALKEKIEELEDRVKRQMAEFENFRKRTDKEKSQMYAMGAKSIVEKVLPVIDNFERGLAAVPDEQKEDAFVDGMNKIYKQMMAMLEEAGVTPIEAVGAEFNPDFHNAVMHIEDDSFGENMIAEELQRGYLYHDTVVRHSMVKVAN